MANKVRGEVTVNLNGHAVRLRPTFDALAVAEENMGRGIMSVLVSLRGEDLRLTDTVELIHACAVDLDLSKDQIAASILEEGLGSFVVPIGQFVAGVVGGAPKDGNPSHGTGSES